MFGKNRARVSVLFDEDDVASSSRVDVVISCHKRSNTSEAKKIQFRQLNRDEFRFWLLLLISLSFLKHFDIPIRSQKSTGYIRSPNYN